MPRKIVPQYARRKYRVRTMIHPFSAQPQPLQHLGIQFLETRERGGVDRFIVGNPCGVTVVERRPAPAGEPLRQLVETRLVILALERQLPEYIAEEDGRITLGRQHLRQAIDEVSLYPLRGRPDTPKPSTMP